MAQSVKRCTGPCGRVKPLDQFRDDAVRLDGHTSCCRACLDAADRARNDAIRDAVFSHYGRACACCGATENLTIDHIKGGGSAHRRRINRYGNGFYRWLVQQRFPPGYQTLCKPCNDSKRGGAACRIDHAAPSGWERCTGPCGRTLPPAAFHRDASRTSGYRCLCKDCRNSQRRVR